MNADTIEVTADLYIVPGLTTRLYSRIDERDGVTGIMIDESEYRPLIETLQELEAQYQERVAQAGRVA